MSGDNRRDAQTRAQNDALAARLTEAVRSNDIDAADHVLRDAFFTSASFRPAPQHIHIALHHENRRMVERLLQHGATLNPADPVLAAPHVRKMHALLRRYDIIPDKTGTTDPHNIAHDYYAGVNHMHFILSCKGSVPDDIVAAQKSAAAAMVDFYRRHKIVPPTPALPQTYYPHLRDALVDAMLSATLEDMNDIFDAIDRLAAAGFAPPVFTADDPRVFDSYIFNSENIAACLQRDMLTADIAATLYADLAYDMIYNRADGTAAFAALRDAPRHIIEKTVPAVMTALKDVYHAPAGIMDDSMRCLLKEDFFTLMPPPLWLTQWRDRAPRGSRISGLLWAAATQSYLFHVPRKASSLLTDDGMTAIRNMILAAGTTISAATTKRVLDKLHKDCTAARTRKDEAVAIVTLLIAAKADMSQCNPMDYTSPVCTVARELLIRNLATPQDFDRPALTQYFLRSTYNDATYVAFIARVTLDLIDPDVYADNFHRRDDIFFIQAVNQSKDEKSGQKPSPSPRP